MRILGWTLGLEPGDLGELSTVRSPGIADLRVTNGERVTSIFGDSTV